MRYVVLSTWSRTDWRVWDSKSRTLVAIGLGADMAHKLAGRLNSGRVTSSQFAGIRAA